MKKEKVKLTDASAIGKKFGSNVVTNRILYSIIFTVILYALSFSVLPSLITSSVPSSDDYSTFVSHYSNTLILTIVLLVFECLILFLTYSSAVKNILKKATIYKTTINPIKSSASVIIGIFFVLVSANSIHSSYKEVNEWNSRIDALDQAIVSFEEIKEAGVDSLTALLLGLDGTENFNEAMTIRIENIEKTKNITSSIIFFTIFTPIVMILLEVFLIKYSFKKLEKAAAEVPGLEEDIYGNTASDALNVANNYFGGEQKYIPDNYQANGYDPSLYN